ncbi:MAG: hypothetical protein ACYCYO_06205 [Bacilli bacterium]
MLITLREITVTTVEDERLHRLFRPITLLIAAACCSLLSGCSATASHTPEQAVQSRVFTRHGQRITVTLAPATPLSLHPVQIGVTVRELGHSTERVHGVWISEHMDAMDMPVPPVTLSPTGNQSFHGTLVFVMQATWKIIIHLDTSTGKTLIVALSVQVQ